MTLHIEDLIKSSDLFDEAFTHKSLSADKNFERLEFLGDSLVGALITELLFKAYPKTSEGDLSRWKSALVGQGSLAEVSTGLDLVKHLRCKESERPHLVSNERIRASILESFFGAYYIEKGFENLQALVTRLFKDQIKKAESRFATTDYKTLFQEEAQKLLFQTPTYKTLEKAGPSHEPYFKVAACLKDQVFTTAGGSSVKEAQRAAAKKAIENLKKYNTETKHGD